MADTQPSRPKIVFGEAFAAKTKASPSELLEEEREKHRRRAERFGTEFVKPERRSDLRDESRKERLKRSGFKTGIDLFTEDEIARRQERAARFGIPEEAQALEYRPVEPDEDEIRKKERAERFGLEYTAPDQAGLIDVDLLEKRQDVDLEVERRPEAIHMYGVDLMSTGDCLKYFGDYGPTYVEWINDSSCNVLFEDAYTAKRAIVGRGRPLPPEDVPMGQEQTLDPSDVRNIPYLWHKGEDFEKQGTGIPLIFRIATVKDVKPRSGPHITRRLWVQGDQKGRRRQPQQPRQPRDEDVDMQTRGERGGKKIRNRKRRRQLGAGDVEMDDAEQDQYEDEPEDPQVQTRQRQAGPSGLFSAAAAGVLIPGRSSEQEPEAAANGFAADTMSPVTADAREVMAAEDAAG
ncbi:hypothetical protein WJX72_010790 [[Myrmecia] bisecta]|uniref:Nuclear cap-binding protein subunit 3 n=1 Tax=[Myrmecia] bisecta TaxID=41462 RepID=A0AAW1PB69_9CHLO